MRIPKSVLADLSLVAITFVWGSTFTIVKNSLAFVSPILFVAMRFWIASALLVVFLHGQFRVISGKSLRQGLLLALVLTGGFIFQTQGLRSTSPSYSAFITSLSVLLVPLLGWGLFRDKPRWQTVVGVVLATCGLGVLLVRIEEIRVGSGEILTLFCALLFAFQILLLGRFVRQTDYRLLMLLQVSGTALACTLGMPFMETPFISWDPLLGLYLILAAVPATAIALTVQARAQQFTTPNRAALIFSLEPFFAALFAYWMRGDVLTPKEWAGGFLILAGILVSELRPSTPGEGSTFPALETPRRVE